MNPNTIEIPKEVATDRAVSLRSAELCVVEADIPATNKVTGIIYASRNGMGVTIGSNRRRNAITIAIILEALNISFGITRVIATAVFHLRNDRK